MAVVTIRTARRSTSPRRRVGDHPKVRLVGARGLEVELPLAPDVALAGVAPRWERFLRAGTRPVVVRAGDGLDELTVDALVGHPDHQQTVDDVLHGIRRLTRDGDRVRWSGLDPQTSYGWWRIDDYAEVVEARAHGSNAVTRASVMLSMVRVSDVRVRVGPVTGGARTSKAPASASEAQRHTVRSGDTLWAIAHRFYGDGSKWRAIADANGVRDPRKLAVGTELTLPAEGRLPATATPPAQRATTVARATGTKPVRRLLAERPSYNVSVQ